MHTFQTVTVVLSMVLGLGVTRLLLGLVTVFRTRRQSPIDWVPLGWACALFLTQLEYWWAISDLPLTRQAYSFVDFVFLVLLTLTLFVAAAIVLPNRSEDETGGLRRYFESDGRYALLAMAAFTALGFLTNVVFFKAPLLALWTLLDIPLIGLLLAGFLFTGGRSKPSWQRTWPFWLPISWCLWDPRHGPRHPRSEGS